MPDQYHIWYITAMPVHDKILALSFGIQFVIQ